MEILIRKYKRGLVLESVGINNEIVLYNDDVNTFDHVETLILKFTNTIKTRQCTIFDFCYMGQPCRKNRSFDELKPQCTQLDSVEEC
jgi:ATP-dependent Clp protease adaptor protein ClpS